MVNAERGEVRTGHSELIQALAGRLTGERHGRLNADCEVSKIHEIYLVRGHGRAARSGSGRALGGQAE